VLGKVQAIHGLRFVMVTCDGLRESFRHRDDDDAEAKYESTMQTVSHTVR
jgi:hypothetical protein